jgi:hypothetical protein
MSATDAAVLRACDPGPLPGHEADTYRVVVSAPAPGGGYHALLLGKQTKATCVIDSRLPDGPAGSFGTLTPGTRDWIGGDLTVEGGHTERGGVTVRDGTVIRPPKQVLQVVVGRVSDRVAKVTFTGVDGASVSVAPVRGGYVASLYTTNASAKALKGPNGTNEVIGTVSAFDAAGKRLAEVDPEAPPSCYVLPNGNQLGSDSSPPEGTLGCKPATRWKW